MRRHSRCDREHRAPDEESQVDALPMSLLPATIFQPTISFFSNHHLIDIDGRSPFSLLDGP